jgi:hypothetical protein
MPVSAWMHESGPLRQGEGIKQFSFATFPRTAVGLRRGDSEIYTTRSYFPRIPAEFILR